MKSRITKTVALAALMAGAAGVANATEGWYGRADAGYAFDGQLDVDGVGAIDLDKEWTQHLGLGYAFDNGLRMEGELSHRFHDMISDPPTLVDGDIHAWSAMANLFWDFNRGGGVEPYIGVGVGVARLNANATGAFPAVDGTDTTLAYQGMIGLNAGLTDQLSLDIGYRYFVAQEAEIDGFAGDFEDQAITIGLRYQFEGAAPPPPPPPPPPPVMPPPPPPAVVPACPTSDFVVYFEWDRSNLNADALATIDSAAARARQCNISSISVTGHTDTSGSPDYNQRLSEQRASVVRDALVARGLNAGQMSSAGTGESNLARATRDGVREPLNRRTAVTISFR